ncbi:MAG: DUF58 domain-containing protein [Acidobacteriota bacterium]
MSASRSSSAEDLPGRASAQGLAWYAVAGGCLLLLSISSQGFFLYAAAVVAFVSLGSLVWSTVSIDRLEVARGRVSQEVELGARVEQRLTLRNGKDWPAPWIFFEDRVDSGVDVEGPRGGCVSLGAGGREEIRYTLHTYRRGLFRLGPTLLETSDPFGLVRRFRVDGASSFLTVLPRPVDMSQGWPLGHQPIHQVPRRRSLLEDPSRFRGVRDYRRGDSLKQVHWRATAKSQRLQVKLFEPSVLDGALIALEMEASLYTAAAAAADGGEGSVGGVDPNEELAITAGVSIAHFVLGGGQSVGLLANGADAAERYPEDLAGQSFRRFEEAEARMARRRHPNRVRPVELAASKGPRQWRRVQTLLARLVPSSGVSLPRLLHVELPSLPRSLVLLVITPRVDAELVAVLLSLRRAGIESAVIFIAGTGRAPEAALPASVPVYTIRRAADLAALGNRRL